MAPNIGGKGEAHGKPKMQVYNVGLGQKQSHWSGSQGAFALLNLKANDVQNCPKSGVGVINW